ncbi:MAG: M1 family aminopeptidase, partial [Chloroflexota bacterium]|nr:M1 family aminopeptidase [Chloroflexota bacterium]
MRSQETAARDVLDKNDATRRSNSISDTQYQINLNLPGGGSPTYSGETIVQFESSDGSDTFLDFTGTEIISLHVNDSEVVNPSWTGHRLHIQDLISGPNKVVISYINEYDHTGDGFHQFIDPEDQKEYVYTNFEPYSAHRLFPSFDQPDIKASYSLQVDCPKEWVLIGNSELAERIDIQDNMSRHRFSKTKRFSTYLFALIGGPYQQFTSTYTSKHPQGGIIPLGFFARESLAPYVDQDELFEVTSQGFEFFEDFFDFPYPFGKYDQIFVPEFNHGAMENVGAITHTERIVFRDPPTYNQRLTRAEIILHEMAHMWFGDLVTMKWWDDL